MNLNPLGPGSQNPNPAPESLDDFFASGELGDLFPSPTTTGSSNGVDSIHQVFADDESRFQKTRDQVETTVQDLKEQGLDIDIVYKSNPASFFDYKGPVMILIPEKHDYNDDADLQHKKLKYKVSEALIEKLDIKKMALEGFQPPSRATIAEMKATHQKIPELLRSKYHDLSHLLALRFEGKNLEFKATEKPEDILEQCIYSILTGMFNDAYLNTNPKDVKASRADLQQTLIYALDPSSEGFQARCKKYNRFLQQTINALGLADDCVLEGIPKNETILFPRLQNTDNLQITGRPGSYTPKGKHRNALLYIYHKKPELVNQRNSNIVQNAIQRGDGTVIMNVGASHASGMVFKELEDARRVPVIVIRAGSHDPTLNQHISAITNNQKQETLTKIQATHNTVAELAQSFPGLPDRSQLR